MSILIVESAWRETGIVCPFCNGKWMTYSDGENRPVCSNEKCLMPLPDETIWKWLIGEPDEAPEM